MSDNSKRYRVVFIEASGNRCMNGLTFATPKEAADYAKGLQARWTGCPDRYEVEEVEEVTS